MSTLQEFLIKKANTENDLWGLGIGGTTGLTAYGTPKAIRNWNIMFGAPDNFNS